MMLGRYGLRSCAEYLVGWSYAAKLLKEVVNEGGLLAALMIRLVPVVPFGVSFPHHQATLTCKRPIYSQLGSIMLGMTDLSARVIMVSVMGAFPCKLNSLMIALSNLPK